MNECFGNVPYTEQPDRSSRINFEEPLGSLTAGATPSLYLRLSQETGNKQRFRRKADHILIFKRYTASTILSAKMGRLARGKDCRSSLLTFKIPLTAFTPHASLPTTSSSDNGGPVTAAQGAGENYLSVECGHRNLECRQGSLEYYAGKGCLWFSQRYPRNYQSESPSDLFVGGMWTEMDLGRDDQPNGLRRTWAGLR